MAAVQRYPSAGRRLNTIATELLSLIYRPVRMLASIPCTVGRTSRPVAFSHAFHFCRTSGRVSPDYSRVLGRGVTFSDRLDRSDKAALLAECRFLLALFLACRQIRQSAKEMSRQNRRRVGIRPLASRVRNESSDTQITNMSRLKNGRRAPDQSRVMMHAVVWSASCIW